MSTLADEIGRLLAAYESCWTRIKPLELRALWDPAETQPFYIAEEIEAPMRTWAEVETYWRQAQEIIATWAVRTWDLHCKLVAPELAALQFMMHWNGTVKGSVQPIGLDVRVSTLARNVASAGAPADWRFTGHFTESPLGPLPYLRATYRRNVDPEFMRATAPR